jgi:hypothetical protein
MPHDSVSCFLLNGGVFLVHACIPWFLIIMAWVFFRRHNATLRTLVLYSNNISATGHQSVALELVLCQMRNVHDTHIDASGTRFDDADVTRIVEALRCEIFRA